MKRTINTAYIDVGLLVIIKSPKNIEKCKENVVLEDIILLKVRYTKIGTKTYWIAIEETFKYFCNKVKSIV